jgi:hypothetical protein
VYYTDPVNDRSQTQFDLARAVFGIGYRFDGRTSSTPSTRSSTR